MSHLPISLVSLEANHSLDRDLVSASLLLCSETALPSRRLAKLMGRLQKLSISTQSQTTTTRSGGRMARSSTGMALKMSLASSKHFLRSSKPHSLTRWVGSRTSRAQEADMPTRVPQNRAPDMPRTLNPVPSCRHLTSALSLACLRDPQSAPACRAHLPSPSCTITR